MFPPFFPRCAKVLERMEELLPFLPTPWAHREERPLALRRALEALDRGEVAPLLEGFGAFLALERHRPSSAALRLGQVEAFLRYLRLLGRPSLAWDRGDFLRFRQDLLDRGLAPQTLVSYLYALRAFLRFLAWAGWEPPPLDLPPKERATRRLSPLSREEFLSLLEALPALPSRWREPLGALLVLTGELGLRLRDALALPVEALDPASFRVRLPGGWAAPSRAGAGLLRVYLDWRHAVRRYPTQRLLLSPSGLPATPQGARHALRALSRLVGRPLSYNLLRLTGQARLVSLHGSRGASRLLGRLLP